MLRPRAEPPGGSSVPVSSTTTSGSSSFQDNLDDLLACLPEDLATLLTSHPQRPDLLEIVMDLGRVPEARFQGQPGGTPLRSAPVTREDLAHAETLLGAFGKDNRAGIEGTLHRISAIRNRRGEIVGLTCRVGRTITGQIDMVLDLLPTSGESGK